MRWPNNGDFWSGNYRVLHTGTIEKQTGREGVELISNKEMGKRVKGYVQYSGGTLLVKVDTKLKETDHLNIHAQICTRR